ncbi:hypothetical protein HDU92_005003 [Lobulomyces angularis]|nr:hypothetical protein HDU92_005003 [Lobulomyces angularis]
MWKSLFATNDTPTISVQPSMLKQQQLNTNKRLSQVYSNDEATKKRNSLGVLSESKKHDSAFFDNEISNSRTNRKSFLSTTTSQISNSSTNVGNNDDCKNCKFLLDNAETNANERVGRKILDLEISNASLNAVNISLENTIRQQAQKIEQMRKDLSEAKESNSTSAGTIDDSIKILKIQNEVLLGSDNHSTKNIIESELDEDKTFSRICLKVQNLIEESKRAIEAEVSKKEVDAEVLKSRLLDKSNSDPLDPIIIKRLQDRMSSVLMKRRSEKDLKSSLYKSKIEKQHTQKRNSTSVLQSERSTEIFEKREEVLNPVPKKNEENSEVMVEIPESMFQQLVEFLEEEVSSQHLGAISAKALKTNTIFNSEKTEIFDGEKNTRVEIAMTRNDSTSSNVSIRSESSFRESSSQSRRTPPRTPNYTEPKTVPKILASTIKNHSRSSSVNSNHSEYDDLHYATPVKRVNSSPSRQTRSTISQNSNFSGESNSNNGFGNRSTISNARSASSYHSNNSQNTRKGPMVSQSSSTLFVSKKSISSKTDDISNSRYNRQDDESIEQRRKSSNNTSKNLGNSRETAFRSQQLAASSASTILNSNSCRQNSSGRSIEIKNVTVLKQSINAKSSISNLSEVSRATSSGYLDESVIGEKYENTRKSYVQGNYSNKTKEIKKFALPKVQCPDVDESTVSFNY